MRNIVICLSLLLFSILVYGQDNNYKVGDQVTVTLHSNAKVSGTVQSVSDEFLVLMNDGEKITIPLKNILYFSTGKVQMDEKEEMEDLFLDYPDQYFLLPSAKPVNPGQIYYRNIMIFGHVFSFGVSDYFSVNAGFETLTLLIGETPVLFITPKVSYPISENISLGAGVTGFFHESDAFAFGFGNMTFGNSRNHVSLGLGYGSNLDEIFNEPLLFGGWNFDFSRKVSWVGEVFFTPLLDDDIDNVLFDTSVRIKFKNNIAIDFGVFAEAGSSPIPTLGVTIPIKG